MEIVYHNPDANFVITAQRRVSLIYLQLSDAFSRPF